MNSTMEFAVRCFLFVFHLGVVAIGSEYLADIISQPINTIWIVLIAIVYGTAVVTIIAHIQNLIKFTKKIIEK